MESNAMGSQKGANGMVVEFMPVLRLKGHDGKLELCLNIGMKREQTRGNVGFISQRESPNVMCEIINENKIKLEGRATGHWRSPYISTYNLKGNVAN